MPPPEKKFVKYTFDESNNRPREQRRPSKQNFRQRDNNQQNRARRYVSYTQKPSSKQNVLKDMISSFVPFSKLTPKVEQLMKNFPKFFNSTPKEPQPFNPQLLNSYLTIMGKKMMDRQAKTFVPIEPESQSDPDWDSDSDIEGGIQSKKIDEQLAQKTRQKLGVVRQLRQDELKRHEKQFLEEYYRQKHLQEQENQKANQTQAEQQKQKSNQSIPSNQEQKSSKKIEQENQWTDYQEKQVQDFVNMGFIQKIQQDDNDFGDDDFSVQDQKSQSQKSGNSSDGDDDIFGDQGPTTTVKKKQVTEQSGQQKPTNLGTVVINNHLFSRIAQAVGIPPGACIWIIKNDKNIRYKVSTQFMDEMYRLNNFCESLPYVSLNHSQFVHNNDVQKQKGLQTFKKFNARKHQQNHHQGHHHHKSGNGNRNYDNNKRKFQYKPNTQQGTKSHLNKK